MAIELYVQRVFDSKEIPTDEYLNCWAQAALVDCPHACLTIRIVDESESAELNSRYRGHTGPTNVLSFPAELPPEIEFPLLGDIVICAPLVLEEAAAQSKEAQAHWAHLVIHGVLHLQGFDHQSEDQAQIMETRETALLADLGFADPYA